MVLKGSISCLRSDVLDVGCFNSWKGKYIIMFWDNIFFVNLSFAIILIHLIDELCIKTK